MKAEDRTDLQGEVKRIEALATDQEHLRQAALYEAGGILRSSERALVENLLDDLDEEIIQDSDLYNAYVALAEGIAREVVRLGDELVKQYRATREKKAELTPPP